MIGDVTVLGDPVETGAAGTVYTDEPVNVERANHQQNTVHDRGWWDGATADQEYITPSIGGEPNVARALGWTTGLGIARMFTSPITGRTLVPPRTVPNPQVGPVGWSGITNPGLVVPPLPTTAQIAASFASPNVEGMMQSG